ncbi:MAG: phosphohistidine phosphatase SixA [Coxiella sp. RIFCSPHIGHO2_12_FULL_42_15]|nr:MAG: phosphohistidine phosphatase SixA [Coxiella sp. RIFCSPHIGHO2_12_FULL_42_15]
MKIYCVRHGHAEALPDASGDRPLTLEGTRELKKVANYLAYRGFHVLHVMHSDKLRSKQTAEILAKRVANETEPEESLLLSPDEPVFELANLIRQWHDDTLLVGHMPNIASLVSELVIGDESKDLVLFSPGTIVCLERHENQNWIINWIVRPELVPDRFLTPR